MHRVQRAQALERRGVAHMVPERSDFGAVAMPAAAQAFSQRRTLPTSTEVHLALPLLEWMFGECRRTASAGYLLGLGA